MRSERPFQARAWRGLVGGAVLLASILAASAAYAAEPCCTITQIDARTGVVTAQELASGRTFQFAAPNAAVLGTMKVGQRIFANFAGQQVSLDGRTACCKIVALG